MTVSILEEMVFRGESLFGSLYVPRETYKRLNVSIHVPRES